jgi:hypothetical protein
VGSRERDQQLQALGFQFDQAMKWGFPFGQVPVPDGYEKEAWSDWVANEKVGSNLTQSAKSKGRNPMIVVGEDKWIAQRPDFKGTSEAQRNKLSWIPENALAKISKNTGSTGVSVKQSLLYENCIVT